MSNSNRKITFASKIEYWWRGRVIPIWKRISVVFIWKIVGVLAACFLFKYSFLTNCLDLQSKTFCATAGVNDNSTLLVIGSFLLAFFVLIPTFWIESKVKDAGKEASQDILKEVREDMVHLSQAQMLLFNADSYQSPSGFLLKEQQINEAVGLWPAFKQVEYRKLGDDFSRAIMNGFYSVQAGADPSGLAMRKDQISLYVMKAIFYLEETVLNAISPDRDGLVNLACMYGCAGRNDLMIRTIEQAIHIDKNARDDFQETKRLSLLILACDSHKSSLEKVGKKIGMGLPLSKEQFTKIITSIDLEAAKKGGGFLYPTCYAVKKVPNPNESAVYIIKFFVDDDGLQRTIHSAQSFRAVDASPTFPHTDLTSTDQKISVDDFFEMVSKEFFTICFESL